MRIVTLNVNGIRSAERKGLARWLSGSSHGTSSACRRSRPIHDDVPKALRAPRKSHAAFHHAQKKGYSGVALYARRAVPVRSGFGSDEFDAEGRYLEADFGDADA